MTLLDDQQKEITDLKIENAVLKERLDSIQKNNWINTLGSVTEIFFKYITFITGLICIPVSLYLLAGKDTNANIVISFLAKITIRETLAWTGTGVCYLLFLKERKQRKDVIESKDKRIKDFESYFDKNRSSSGITPRGETNPADLK